MHDAFEVRFRRWELQAAARRLLPGHRVRVCLRYPVPRDDQGVRVYRREDHGTYYGGLMTCGSIWGCAVCAGKVSERRRMELRPALGTWRSSGGDVLMLTLTVPHTVASSAFGLTDQLLRLVERLNSGKRALSSLLPGYAGQVRALEVTHGGHGWHPHLHVLVLLEQPLSESGFLGAYGAVWGRWEGLVSGSGLGVPSPRAFSLQDGSAAADYVAKFGHEPRWSAAEEVTKQIAKRARSVAGRTPFALLEDASRGDQSAGRLFAEFVGAFKGRRQLRWSPGLRDRLGLTADRTDEEVAAAVDAADELAARISDVDWALIVRRDLRAIVLELLREGTWSDVAGVLERERVSA